MPTHICISRYPLAAEGCVCPRCAECDQPLDPDEDGQCAACRARCATCWEYAAALRGRDAEIARLHRELALAQAERGGIRV